MTEQELLEKVGPVLQLGTEMSKRLAELVGPTAEGLLGVHLFVANQHLQDAMNRVSNMAAILRQQTDENVQKVVDEAAAKGELRVLPPNGG